MWRGMVEDRWPGCGYSVIGMRKNTSLSAPKLIKDINFKKNGKYTAVIEGDLSIHGTSKKVKQSGTLEVKDGKVIAYAKFNLAIKDYNISIPSAVAGKISDQVQVTVDTSMDLKK